MPYSTVIWHTACMNHPCTKAFRHPADAVLYNRPGFSDSSSTCSYIPLLILLIGKLGENPPCSGEACMCTGVVLSTAGPNGVEHPRPALPQILLVHASVTYIPHILPLHA